MGFSSEELAWLDKNSDKLEACSGPEGLDELFKDLDKNLSFSQRIRLKFILAYTINPNLIIAEISKNRPGDHRITGCLYNLTSERATGVPLTPSLFKANTSVVLFKIEKDQIVKQDVYKLTTRLELQDLLTKEGYNLIVLNKRENLLSVDKSFGKNRIYEYKVHIRENLTMTTLTNTEVIGSSDKKLLDQAKEKLVLDLETGYKGFGSTWHKIVEKAFDNVKYI